MSLGDTVDYTKLQLADQDFVGMTVNFTTDYQDSTLIIDHNLGYVPIVLAYHDSAFGDHDPSTVTATNYTANPMPHMVYTDGFGLGVPEIYSTAYCQVDSSQIIFIVQQWTTQDASEVSHFFKYFLFKQPAKA